MLENELELMEMRGETIDREEVPWYCGKVGKLLMMTQERRWKEEGARKETIISLLNSSDIIYRLSGEAGAASLREHLLTLVEEELRPSIMEALREGPLTPMEVAVRLSEELEVEEKFVREILLRMEREGIVLSLGAL